jgi:hypothetical protein
MLDACVHLYIRIANDDTFAVCMHALVALQVVVTMNRLMVRYPASCMVNTIKASYLPLVIHLKSSDVV